MIKSMTGYASVSREDEVCSIGVTVRAVNHRHLDLQVRLPQTLAAAEPRLRALAQERAARGRIEMTVALQMRQPPRLEVELNQELAAALVAALDAARARGLVEGALSPGDLLRLPQALAVRERPAETDAAIAAQVQARTEQAVAAALSELDVMRAREGGYLAADLDARRDRLAALLGQIVDAAADGQAGLEARLGQRVRELALEGAEPAAVAQEIVRVVARSDVSEEVVRFRAHLSHWKELADAPEPCGRKLDFLLQEMNREVNTLGAKAEGARVSALIVEVKAELERVREQVQNVE